MRGTERLVRFKIFFFLLFNLICIQTYAQVFPDSVVDSLLKTGIKLSDAAVGRRKRCFRSYSVISWLRIEGGKPASLYFTCSTMLK